MACLFAMCVSACGAAGPGANSNPITLPQDRAIDWGTWGAASNGLCVGVLLPPSIPSESPSQAVVVYVLTSRTNAFWNYLGPPSGGFSKLELLDANGLVVPPRSGGKATVREFPASLRRKELPMSPDGRMFLNELALAAGQPSVLRRFSLYDGYRIVHEGDYTLTVAAAIYEFAPDRQSVSRIDLPPVKAKIHLAASVPSGMSPRATTAYVAGAALCVAGVVWLVAHRRKRPGENAGPQTTKAVTS